MTFMFSIRLAMSCQWWTSLPKDLQRERELQLSAVWSLHSKDWCGPSRCFVLSKDEKFKASNATKCLTVATQRDMRIRTACVHVIIVFGTHGCHDISIRTKMQSCAYFWAFLSGSLVTCSSEGSFLSSSHTHARAHMMRASAESACQPLHQETTVVPVGRITFLSFYVLQSKGIFNMVDRSPRKKGTHQFLSIVRNFWSGSYRWCKSKTSESRKSYDSIFVCVCVITFDYMCISK